MSKSIVPKEEWKPVAGYENEYKISNTGVVKSIARGVHTVNLGGPCISQRKERFMKPHIDRYGYEKVNLSKNKIKKHWFVHALVANAFIGKMPRGCNQINHKDSNKTNNNEDNLEWCDGKRNQAHSYKNGTHTLNLNRCPRTGRVLPKGSERKYTKSRSGHVGVSFNKLAKKWIAYISIDRKHKHLGSFSKKEDAVEARRQAECNFGFHHNHGL